jgi:hypothetical protein
VRPRLIYSTRTHRVHVITRYQVTVGPDGQELFEVVGNGEYDVTEDFDRVAKERVAAIFPTTRLKRLRQGSPS